MDQFPLPDSELVRLQLQSIHRVAAAERATLPPAEPLPADHEQALRLLQTMEETEKAPLHVRGQLNELARLLRTERPDILNENKKLTHSRSLVERMLRTLGLN